MEVIVRAGQRVHRSGRRDAPPWVLLHGFTGHPDSYRGLRHALPIGTPLAALTLPGHGPRAGAPRPRDFDDVVDGIARVLEALHPDPLPVLGYSLGARVAFGLASRHPARVRRLVAIGGHPGLTTPRARAARRRTDAGWASRLRGEGLEAFLAAWAALPLFASQAELPSSRRQEQARVRGRHRAEALAWALELLSLGRMPDHRPGLRRYPGRVDLVAGARDPRFVALLRDLQPRLAQGHLHLLPGCGHNPVLERARAIARLMTK